MPEYAAARIGPRSALPAPALGYEIAQVVKGPAPETPAVASGPSKANDLMQALGVAAKLIPTAVDVGMAVKEHRTKEGAQARFVGDALDPNQSNAFIDGYERMDGQYRGVAFGNAAQEFAKTNSHLPPDEFQKGLDALQNEYVGKLIHQGQLDTFLPVALKGGEHAASIYQEAKNAEILQERNAKTTAISKATLHDTADSALKEIGIPGGIQQLTDNPLLASTVIANKEKFVGLVGPALRAHLDEMRTNYKSLGLSTAVISANLLGEVGRLAKATATPELMSYAFIKDESGRSVADTYPAQVDEFMQHAVQNRKTFTHEALVLQRQQEKDATVAYTNGMIFATASIPSGDNVAAAQVLTSFQSNPLFAKMDPSDTRRMAEDLFSIVHRRGFAKESDPDVYTDLRLRAELKTTTPQEIYASRKLLSFGNYSEILNNLEAKTTKAKDEAKDAELDIYRRTVETELKSLEQVLHPIGPGGAVLNPNNATVLARARSQFLLSLEDALKANGNKRENLRTAEINKLGKTAVENNLKDVKYILGNGKPVSYYDQSGKPAVEASHGAVKPGGNLPPMSTASKTYTDFYNQPYK